MRVALDVSSLTGTQISGVGVYTVELLRALQPLVDVVPFCRLSRWKYRHAMREHVGEVRPWLAGVGVDASVVHGPDFRVIPARGRARVVTVHDLAFTREGMTSPDFRRKKKADLDRELRGHPPDAIITVSEATRRDLIEVYPELEPRTHVVYLGGDHLKRRMPAPTEPGDHFLFVGNLEARKNVLGILRAFEIHARHAPTRLVLVGKPGYGGEKILKAVEQSSVRERIELVGYCANEKLSEYYRGALALVYPSVVEGFGLPVLEAMLQGCPVITSASTACAEIVGENAWLVAHEDDQAIARAMDEAMELKTSPERRRQWVEAAQKRAAHFTWAKCATETLEVYNRALEARA